MIKLATIITLLTVVTAFVPPSPQAFRGISPIGTLNMSNECPEIPITAQMDPKYDTAIIALG